MNKSEALNRIKNADLNEKKKKRADNYELNFEKKYLLWRYQIKCLRL